MKRLFYTLCSVVIGLACHRTTDAVNPADPLYRRWAAVNVSDTYITFQSDGVILYGPDGSYGICCSPRFFVRQDSVLRLKDAPAKPLPSFVKPLPGNCANVSCLSAGDSWKILRLSADQLIIQTLYGKQTYKAD